MNFFSQLDTVNKHTAGKTGEAKYYTNKAGDIEEKEKEIKGRIKVNK